MQPIGCLSSDLFRKNFDSIWKDAQQAKVNAFNVVKFTKDYYVETLNCQYSKKGEQANFTKLQNSCIYKKKITVYEEIVVNNFCNKAASFILFYLRILYNMAEKF